MTSDREPALCDEAPDAWAFHRASSRWAFNMLSPGADETPEAGKDYGEATFTVLPPPGELAMALGETIERRVSCRAFSPAALNPRLLSTILFNALGVIGTSLLGSLELAKRPAPSPGGMYPLEIYVIARHVEGVSSGIYHYQPIGHGLSEIRDGIAPFPLDQYLFMGQPYAANAPVTLVIAAVFHRSLKKYRDRGYRYALIEAGHIGQNVALACEALGLGSCSIGGFLDIELAQLLKLDVAREFPLYAIALGPQDASDRL
jgi:SagB-type dehydrogenase family enzyme